MHLAQIARSAYLRVFEDLLGTDGGRRTQLYDGLSPSKTRLPRRLISIERLGAHTPKPAKNRNSQISRLSVRKQIAPRFAISARRGPSCRTWRICLPNCRMVQLSSNLPIRPARGQGLQPTYGPRTTRRSNAHAGLTPIARRGAGPKNRTPLWGIRWRPRPANRQDNGMHPSRRTGRRVGQIRRFCCLIGELGRHLHGARGSASRC